LKKLKISLKKQPILLLIRRFLVAGCNPLTFLKELPNLIKEIPLFIIDIKNIVQDIVEAVKSYVDQKKSGGSSGSKGGDKVAELESMVLNLIQKCVADLLMKVERIGLFILDPSQTPWGFDAYWERKRAAEDQIDKRFNDLTNQIVQRTKKHAAVTIVEEFDDDEIELY